MKRIYHTYALGTIAPRSLYLGLRSTLRRLISGRRAVFSRSCSLARWESLPSSPAHLKNGNPTKSMQILIFALLLIILTYVAIVSWGKCGWPARWNYQGTMHAPRVSPLTLLESGEWSPLPSCELSPQVLGTPTREEIRCMNPHYTEFRFPQIKAHPWHKVPLTPFFLFFFFEFFCPSFSLWWARELSRDLHYSELEVDINLNWVD